MFGYLERDFPEDNEFLILMRFFSQRLSRFNNFSILWSSAGDFWHFQIFLRARTVWTFQGERLSCGKPFFCRLPPHPLGEMQTGCEKIVFYVVVGKLDYVRLLLPQFVCGGVHRFLNGSKLLLKYYHKYCRNILLVFCRNGGILKKIRTMCADILLCEDEMFGFYDLPSTKM